MQKSVVRRRPGNLVGRKQSKQFNKEGPIAFLNIEYRETSAGPQTKASSKDTLAKPEDLKGCFSPYAGGGGPPSAFHSFQFNFHTPPPPNKQKNNKR